MSRRSEYIRYDDYWDKESKKTMSYMKALCYGLVASIPVFIAGASGVGLGRLIPVEQKTRSVIEKVTVEKREVVTIPRPSNVAYNKLSDPSKACSGWPVVIEQINAAPSQGDKDGERITWMKVRPAGDDYTVACRLQGDWSDTFKQGDIIALPQGKLG